MTRRNMELALLCIAAPIVLLLFAMMVINQGQELNVTTLGTPLGLFCSFVVAHIAVRKFAPGADPAILPIVFALSGIGIAFVTSLSPENALGQVVWLFLGVVLMILALALVRNLDALASYKYTLMLVGIALLLSPLLPGIGWEAYGSQIWIKIGSYTFQPGEVAKIFIVLFLAGYLAQNREMLSVFTHKVGPFHFPDFRTLLPLLVMWLIAMLVVVFEKDLGSALVLFFVFLTMLYVATGKKSYLAIGLGLAAIGAVFLFSCFTHVQTRVETWLDPFADATGDGYQLVQAIYHMANGDLFGIGIGKGDYDSFPVISSDFIFVSIAEQIGLLGAAGVLLLFLCLGIRGLVTAARAKSDVSSFIAVGSTAVIVLQAFIIVGGVTRLIPLTGITLPFISQGGSSLIASFVLVGLLLKCGDEATGVGTEMLSGTSSIRLNGVLGRVSLGKRLTTVAVLLSLMFAALAANLTVIMVVKAEEYKEMPSNNITLAKQAEVERGTISTYDGVILAQSVPNEDGTYSRVYPAGPLASHVVGYCSEQYGTSGIEASYNEVLQGNSSFASWTDVLNYYAGINTAGNDVKLTINSKVQQAAQDALDGYTGACVVLDPTTGAVLAMASSPTYNASDAEAMLEAAAAGSASSELLNRATQSLYAPGSTFKTLTLSAALELGLADENTVYDAPAEMDIGGGKVTNYADEELGNITLSRATDLSSNTVFGQVGVQVGAKNLVDYANKFGFNQDIGLEIPLATSLMPNPDEMTEWETAWAACGQPVGEHESPAGPQATVLQMAMVGAAIANDGVIQKPYFVDSIYNSNGEKASETTPQLFSQPITAETANRVTEVLEGVVNSGTGTAAAIDGVQVAGKTGTAETGKAVDDSWFVGFAPSDKPSVVVAIVLEEAGSGTSTGRAQNVLRAALEVQGDL